MFLLSESTLLPFYLIWSIYYWPVFSGGESLSNVYEKECDGSNSGLTYTHDPDERNRYRKYERQYGNCTRVRANLEIVFMQLTDAQYDFSFLENIREVDGYVLIYGNHVPKIRLTNLRVIRGYDLYKDANKEEFGLFVAQNSIPNANSVGLEELQLPSLVEILHGKVMFKGNSRLCFGENTINWNHILLDGRRFVNSAVPGYEKINCSNSGACHENCSQRFCWGPGADMCQTINTCEGNDDERCTRDNEKCHHQCIAGCNRQEDSTKCLSCRNFARGSECVRSCSEQVRKPGTNGKSTYVTLPDNYTQGSKCVEKCDAGFTLQDDNCVHSCKTGYKVENNICIQCPGECPKTCTGTGGLWIAKKDLPRFTGCKIVEGNLDIFNESFTRASISVDDLQRLSDVEVITGQLAIQAWRSDFTSLNFLRNLREINGAGLSGGDNPLEIHGTSLTSLGLRSLERVVKGIYIVGNKDLCYADGIKWTNISTGTLSVEGNKNSSICRHEGFTCSPVCQLSDGCFGPGDDDCVTCQGFQQIDLRCSNCSTENGFYTKAGIRGNLECRPCNSSCNGSCFGDGPEHCYECKNVRHQNVCVDACPLQTYRDSNRVCQPCHSVCDQCTGNRTVLGDSGCKNCQNRTIRYEDETRHCISGAEECSNETYFKRSESVQIYMDPHDMAMTVCRECHPECIGCNGSEPTQCRRCRNKHQYKKNILECVSECSKDFYYAGNRLCMPCHAQCLGCNGSGNYDCKECRFVRIFPNLPPGWTEKDIGNNSDLKPYCDRDCPNGQVKHKVENRTEGVCRPIEFAYLSTDHKVFWSIGVIVLFFVIVGGVSGGIYYRIQKKRQLREKILVDEIPMIASSGAKPDMSSLRLIKESELRCGNVIGSGAFGTVYKGIWIPDKENVKIPVAIKVLQEKSDSSLNTELLDEARIMASVCHPNCVRILAVCMTAQMMLVTQLMPLGCLLDYVRKERSNIGSRALLLWSVQIAKGMKYLEDLGIVHRDLAARNVLVYNSNQVKITDFGLARLLDYEEEEIHSEGGKMPIKWLALECIQHRIYTHKSDVWSYGVTLWEMFSYGQRPYENLQARQVPQALEKGERLPQPEVCTIDVYMILIKCWMLDAESRPTFSDLVGEFTRMAADPGRFLVIRGDTLMRLPSQSPDATDLIRLMSLQLDDSDLMIMSAEEYLRPKDLEAENNDDLFSSDNSQRRPLTIIQEGVVYENSETAGARATTPMEDDDAEATLARKLSYQCSRQNSQRYVANPFQTEGDKDVDKPDGSSSHFVVDEEGYLPPQSVAFPPSYLDLVYHSTHDNPNSTEKRKQASMDMNVACGISKDNPEYYDKEDTSPLLDYISKTDKLNGSADADKANKPEPVYCNSQLNEYSIHL